MKHSSCRLAVGMLLDSNQSAAQRRTKITGCNLSQYFNGILRGFTTFTFEEEKTQ